MGAKEALVAEDVAKDADGTVHTRYSRTYAGLPVIGADLIVHERAGEQSVTRTAPQALSVPAIKAVVSSAAARKAALAAADEGAPSLPGGRPRPGRSSGRRTARSGSHGTTLSPVCARITRRAVSM